MPRKSTIAHAQKILSADEFAAWSAMPCKLSKAQLDAGERPPSLEEQAQAREAAKAAREAKKAEKQAAKAARGPQTPEAQLKIFDALELGYALTARRDGEQALRFEVVKVNKKSVRLQGAKGESAVLRLGKSGLSLAVDGKAVQFSSLRYKAPKVEGEAPKGAKGKGKRKPKAAPAKAAKAAPVQEELSFLGDLDTRLVKAEIAVEEAFRQLPQNYVFEGTSVKAFYKASLQAVMSGADAREAVAKAAAQFGSLAS